MFLFFFTIFGELPDAGVLQDSDVEVYAALMSADSRSAGPPLPHTCALVS